MKKNNFKHIVLIGAGKIGNRHLQGLNNIKFNVKITVIDININSLKIAKNLFLTYPKNIKIIEINFLKSLKKIDTSIDLAIIATNSFERLSVIYELIKYTKLKYLVIEKVAFPSVSEFKKSISILKKNKIKTWVNCTRRIDNLYILLKKKLVDEKKITIYCTANNLNIASNAIHLLDLLVFLSNSMISDLDLSFLKRKIYKSKRKNYIEFKGCLLAYTKRGDKLIMIDDNTQSQESFLTINTHNYKIIIYVNLNIAINSSRSNNWKISKIKFDTPFQSKLTNIFAKDIIYKGKCGLTEIKESFLIHKIMLNQFVKFINKISKKKINSCMIT